jgi:hypothetical protein
VALSLLAGLGGCGPSIVQTDNPVPITSGEYNRVFDASIHVLRDRGFTPSRQDRRFGVITTFARPASTVAEPWRSDNTTAGQAFANTLNHRRRTVRVDLKKRGDATGAPDRPAAEAEAAPADGALADYQLAVAVQLEQRQHPPRNLHTAAASSVAQFGRSAGARQLVTAMGAETSFWRPLGRDAYLEQRLIAAILDRAAAMEAGRAPSDDADEPVEADAEQPSADAAETGAQTATHPSKDDQAS